MPAKEQQDESEKKGDIGPQHKDAREQKEQQSAETRAATNPVEAGPVPPEGAPPYPPETASEAAPVMPAAPVWEGGDPNTPDLPPEGDPVNTSANSLEYEKTAEPTAKKVSSDDDDKDD